MKSVHTDSVSASNKSGDDENTCERDNRDYKNITSKEDDNELKENSSNSMCSIMVGEDMDFLIEKVMLDEEEGMKTEKDFIKESGMTQMQNAVLLEALKQAEENEKEYFERIRVLEEMLRMKDEEAKLCFDMIDKIERNLREASSKKN